jgi:hypothetical protein
MKEASEGLSKGSSLVWPFVQDRTGQDRIGRLSPSRKMMGGSLTWAPTGGV